MAGGDGEHDVLVRAILADAVLVAESVGGSFDDRAQFRLGDGLGGIGGIGEEDGVVLGSTAFVVYVRGGPLSVVIMDVDPGVGCH